MGAYVAFMHVFFKRPEAPHPAIVSFKHWTVRVKDDTPHDKVLQVFKKAFQQAHPNWEILTVSLHEHPHACMHGVH